MEKQRSVDSVVLGAEEEARIDGAVACAGDLRSEEVAVAAEYDPRQDLLIVRLQSGQRLAIPREDLERPADADPQLVSEVRLEMLGLALRWERLDIDFRVDSLRRGVYGSERWMRQLGRRRAAGAEEYSRTA